jgi:hypothetical protein
MEDDGSFTSDEVPEIAQAMAGQWVLFRRHFPRSQGGLCQRFLQRQADLLGAELTSAGDRPHDAAPHKSTGSSARRR